MAASSSVTESDLASGSTDSPGVLPVAAPSFTSEQYSQILDLLNKVSSVDSSANLAGISHCLSVSKDSPRWILDTGATDHMISDSQSLISPISCATGSRFVYLPNGNLVPVNSVGSYAFDSAHSVTNVLHVPHFKHNLLSVSKLTRDFNCSVTFFPDFCVLQGLFDGKMKGIGKESRGLYLFDSSSLASGLSFPVSSGSHSFNIHSTVCMHSILDNNTSLWHARLGHVPSSKLHHVPFLQSLSFDDKLIHSCTVCPLARQTRQPFSHSVTRSPKPFDLVHLDIWGPYRISTHSGHRYFLTIVDDHSRMTWVYLLKHKSETLLYLKQFIQLVKNQFSASIRYFRSDNGSEFFNSECSSLFTNLGIIHQTSCVHTPQQNGVAERKHRHLLELQTLDSDFLRLSPSPNSPLPLTPASPPATVPSSTLPASTSIPGCSSSPHVPPRRSSRITKPPNWLHDFITSTGSSSSQFSISNHISYSHLPTHTQLFLSSTSSLVEPKSYSEAIQNPAWIKAMEEEISALESNNTWSVVPLPPGKFPIGCKWVYKIKYKASGEVERFKARLVAKGYSQKEGVDYGDTFSPVAKLVTVRAVLALASIFLWPLFQMDVFNAFLQGDLCEEVYMELPAGFCSQEGTVCRLQKSLYGLKQASRQWNLKLTQALVSAGFQQSKFDYSLFTKRQGGKVVLLLIYVDDLVITGNDEFLIKELKGILNQNFKMKDLGELKYFLGLEILRSKDGIFLNQRKYALELIADSGIGGAKSATTPLEQNTKLTAIEYDQGIRQEEKEDSLLQDKTVYQRLIGRLLYLTHTRPDITYAVHYLSQFMQYPKVSHLNAALRVVRYIKNCPGQGILLSSSSSCQLIAFCDSDWASCPMSRKSVTGFCIKLGSSLISWKAKKQNTVARSSAEAEYRSMAATASEIVWLNGLLEELGANLIKPSKLFCDSKAALQIAANPVFHERTKHIEIDCHFIREKIQEGLIQTEHVASEEQLADVLTKALGIKQHGYLVSKLGVKDVFQPPT
ncbi:hypothetical protein CXB51_012012 [Gossypium anomalum]|uniref:Integrase catalytic domain-containing protein n=1 Tax=Gossypium anomalum TaxID=47600 RepID=A0A8J5YQJ2_9ROSI|nr:hypothetical protein CXB51_012012 [Gossypium anomalum]